jgi:inosine-uridine nucleoside N-ribohydrolase
MRVRARHAWWLLGGVVLVAVVVLALPVHTWRTGETPLPPLSYTASPRSVEPAALWIDTDPACGTGEWHDPDDCLALLALLRSPARRIAGVSTTFGNAPLPVTDRVARELVAAIADQARTPAAAVHRGCGAAGTRCLDDGGSQAAHTALTAALRQERLVVLALGPLTNLAHTLQHEPALAARVIRVVAVMGHRPGHRFHPGEARSHGAMLFGHGPVFSDLNAEFDTDAVQRVLASGVALDLVPYSAARQVPVNGDDLEAIAALGADGAWVAQRSRTWLDRWRDSIGIDGFYPFDALAAAHVLGRGTFECADVQTRVARDPLLTLFGGEPQLLVSQGGDGTTAVSSTARVRYCDRVKMKPCTLFATCRAHPP